jgi:hypothetical protein
MHRWFLLLLFCSFPVLAEENDGWEDDWAETSAYELSHELSFGYSFLVDDVAGNGQTVMNEFRTLSEFVYKADSFTFNFNTEILLDELTGTNDISIDQLNFMIPFSNGIDLKVGRQVITWGTGDMLFLNDLFSKSWLSFFNGRDNILLKPAVDAVRFSHYGKSFNYELAVLPEFAADETPNGERYSFYVPGFGIIKPQPEFTAKAETDPEVFARLFANVDGVEWALYGYSGFFKSPAQINPLGQLGYSKMTSLGASLRLSLAGGLLNTEIASYQSIDDKNGTDPFIQNSQLRFLIGYEKEVVTNLTMALQAYLEKTLSYQALLENLEAGQLFPEENRTMLTMRLTHQAMQQKLMSSLMIFMSPSDDDYYFRYSSRYSLSDQWKIVVGLNWLDGDREETFLAQMKNNSNLFFRVHYSFE